MKNDDFEVLYKKYNRELYIYALSLCKDHHLSQDLVSETFFKALLSLDIGEGYIKYWLFRVCKNLYLDYLKKNSRLEDMESSANKLSIEDNTLDKIILNEDRRRIYFEILSLQPSYKDILLLQSFLKRNLSYYWNFTGSC
ncbi:MAG: sigma-70 family RNA polymerase sigma factor [Peptostreptococcaceae bacterium]